MIKKITNFLLKLAADAILTMYEAGASFYDASIFQTVNILTKSPLEMASGNVGALLNSLLDGFRLVGLTLCGLSFFAGWVMEANDVNADFRFEAVLKRAVHFGIASFFVSCCSQVMIRVNEIGCSLVNAAAGMSGAGSVSYYIGASVQGGTLARDYSAARAGLEGYMFTGSGDSVEYLEDFSRTAIGAVLVALAFYLICIGGGILIIYTAYIRFFKILLCVPYSGLAFGTLAGGRQLARTGESYIRYILAQQMQAVTMVLALVLAGTILNSGTAAEMFGSDALWLRILCDMFMVVCALGAVKSSEQITERALGLR